MSALAELFPTQDGLPAEWLVTPDDTGLRLLIDGRLERWDGAPARILSAVCGRNSAGGLEQLDLGPAAAAGKPEAARALEAALRSWNGGRGDWPRSSPEERIACCLDFVKRARPLREAVARALTWEVGKPYADSLLEFDRTMAYVLDTCETLRQLERDNAAAVRASGFAARIRRAPLGVALCLGPYNYAVNEVYTIAIPALIMGNPTIVKTPRYGVRANALLAEALKDAFPAGVVSLLTGDGATLIGPLMESGRVDVLALIGSKRTATVLSRQHPEPYRLRQVLGLGAKNPAVVLQDADLDLAAAEIVSGALTFNGQRCTALKHVLVEPGVAEPLLERLKARVEALRVGMPWEPGVTITPLPDPKHPGHMDELVRDALAHGGRVVNAGGGEFAGTLYRPALVRDVAPEARLFHEEQFGPVVPVSVVADADAALDVIAGSHVGQQASLFGRDPAILGRMLDHLANLVCRVNLDSQCRRGPDVYPFTGRKDSALGTLSVYDALRTFSIRSLVAVSEKRAGLLDELGARSRFLAQPD